MLMVYGFAAIDLETTGLSLSQDKIIEVSAVLYDEDGVEEGVLSTLIKPGIRIPPAASRVNRISDEMVRTSPTFAAVAPALADALRNRILVGHNVISFDARFLASEFAAAGLEMTHHSVLDTLHLSRKAYPHLKSHKLAILCDLAGIENKTAHRAESDARATWHLLCVIAKDDIRDVTKLARFNFPVLPGGVIRSNTD